MTVGSFRLRQVAQRLRKAPKGARPSEATPRREAWADDEREINNTTLSSDPAFEPALSIDHPYWSDAGDTTGLGQWDAANESRSQVAAALRSMQQQLNALAGHMTGQMVGAARGVVGSNGGSLRGSLGSLRGSLKSSLRESVG
eukprot:1004255-Prorocentrum_minimum.AAC.1